MKEACTHIPTHTHTHTNVLKVSRSVIQRSRLQKPLLMVSGSVNSVIITLLGFLYLSVFLLSFLCFTLLLHLRLVATRGN